MQKRQVLVFNNYYLPGYIAGGPIRTLANMVDRLGDEFDFKIVTKDRDSGESEAYSGISSLTWNKVGKASVKYLDPLNINFSEVKRHVEEVDPDVIYLNSYFDFTFTIKILLMRKLGIISDIPIVLAPRGEFSEGALRINGLKKKAYILFFRWFGLYEKLTWQASSEFEKKDIQTVLTEVGDDSIRIALNLAPARNEVALYEMIEKQSNKVKIVFLARIAPKKNLKYALEVLNFVTSEVEFSIYGPKEVPKYWDECEALIKSLPKNVKVHWGGVVKPEDVHKTLSQFHLFFFPTLGENYGHVIHEALSSGLPVLISDQTPWYDISLYGVGWTVPLSTPTLFAEKIDEVAGWSNDEFLSVSHASKEYALAKDLDCKTLEANRCLFLL